MRWKILIGLILASVSTTAQAQSRETCDGVVRGLERELSAYFDITYEYPLVGPGYRESYYSMVRIYRDGDDRSLEDATGTAFGNLLICSFNRRTCDEIDARIERHVGRLHSLLLGFHSEGCDAYYTLHDQPQ